MSHVLWPFGYCTGFEGTHRFGAGTDVLETTEHTARFREDFAFMKRDGIAAFRACIPWHQVELVRNVYNWTWVDNYLDAVAEFGLRPIVDLLHHTSFPEWMT